MGLTSVRPTSPLVRGNPHFRGLDNLLGVVYEAAYNYMSMRGARSSGDSVTYVGFSGTASCPFQGVSLSGQRERPQDLLGSMMAARKPSGTTDFSCGLQLAHRLLQESRSNGQLGCRKPIFVIMTDSQDLHSSATLPKLQAIMHAEAALPPPQQLVLHLLGFGPEVNEQYLATLARMGNGSHHVCRGEATRAALELVSAFEALAVRPDRRGALLPRGQTA